MARDQELGAERDRISDSTAIREGWSEKGRRWYEEMKEEEASIAPWLSLEWTGEWMRVRRG